MKFCKLSGRMIERQKLRSTMFKMRLQKFKPLSGRPLVDSPLKLLLPSPMTLLLALRMSA